MKRLQDELNGVEQPNDTDDSRDTKRYKNDALLYIQEADVGIECFVHEDMAGFSGILKHRYTDFIVNEIDASGKVVILLQDEKVVPADATTFPKEHVDTGELETMVGEETANAILGLLEQLPHQQKVLTAVIPEKEKRTSLHKYLRDLSGHFDSITLPDETIEIRFTNKPASRQGKEKGYVHISMYKENKDTMEVVSLLARLLRVPNKSIAFAGTKDRRGVTCQRLSFQRMSKERLLGLNKTLRGIKLGNAEYAPKQLSLGDLSGNEFVITMRDVQASDDTICSALDALRMDGFVNYYGLQRFGTSEIGTHMVGKHLLANDFVAAFDLIIKPCQGQHHAAGEGRQIWNDTKDAAAALDKMPQKCVAEYNILQSLARKPKDLNGAFYSIPRNLRMMYVHAYQSYVWNRVCSHRVKMGMTPVAGDLVEAGWENGFQRARPLQAAELENFSIHDVLLPSPGFDVLYPQHLLDVYKGIMAADGLDPENMKRMQKELSLPGAYRHVIYRPQGVEYEILHYRDPDTDLNQTQLQKMDRVEELGSHAERQAGDLKAVRVSLQLGTSQYATMALREVRKRSEKIDEQSSFL